MSQSDKGPGIPLDGDKNKYVSDFGQVGPSLIGFAFFLGCFAFSFGLVDLVPSKIVPSNLFPSWLFPLLRIRLSLCKDLVKGLASPALRSASLLACCSTLRCF